MQFCPRDSSELLPTLEVADRMSTPPGDSGACLRHEIVKAPEGRYRILETVTTTPIGEVCFAEDRFLGRRVTKKEREEILGPGLDRNGHETARGGQDFVLRGETDLAQRLAADRRDQVVSRDPLLGAH